MALQTRPDGELVLVAGATRSGKTVWTAQRTWKHYRALVWDAKDEWGHRYNCRRISCVRELAEACKPGAKLERIAYVPDLALESMKLRDRGDAYRECFDVFCRLAWIWLRVARGALIVEELADVTHPGKAPIAWGRICRSGLAYGPSIYALTQRPSESDKTALGNATLLHVHQMASEADERYMARELRCDQARVAALRPLQFLERDRMSGAAPARAGSVKIRTLAA